MATTPTHLLHAVPLFRRQVEAGGDFCVFDLETTDKLETKDENRVPKGKVMQIAARRYRWDRARQQGILLGQLNTLVADPTMTWLDPNAFKAHKLTIERCQRQGRSPQQAWGEFLRLARGAVLMGHNIVKFDIPFANRELERNGIPGALDPAVAIDTILMARELFNFKAGFDRKPYSLRELANYLHVRTDPALDHDALGDIDTDWQIFLAMGPYWRSFGFRFLDGEPNQYKNALGGMRKAS